MKLSLLDNQSKVNEIEIKYGSRKEKIYFHIKIYIIKKNKLLLALITCNH